MQRGLAEEQEKKGEGAFRSPCTCMHLAHLCMCLGVCMNSVRLSGCCCSKGICLVQREEITAAALLVHTRGAHHVSRQGEDCFCSEF